MTQEFGSIFELCEFVLNMSIQSPTQLKNSLVKMTLSTLGAFLSWIPLGYIFEKSLISSLIIDFLQVPAFRIETLKCLTEVAGLRGKEQTIYDSKYEDVLLMIFIKFIDQTNTIIGNSNLVQEYGILTDKQIPLYENFCIQLGMFLTNYLTNHLDLIEKTFNNFNVNEELKTTLQGTTKMALGYLLQLSQIPNDEVFKICVEYWNHLIYMQYQKTKTGMYTVYYIYIYI